MRRGALAAGLLLLLGAFAGLAMAQEVPSKDDAVAQVKSMRKAGRLPEALLLLERARAVAPRDELLAGLHGLCLLDAGQDARAAEVAAPFADYAGAEPRLRTLLGRLAQRTGRSDEACAHFEAALAADGRLLEPAVELVRTHMAAGRFGAAATAAARVEAMQPELGRGLAADALVAHGDKLQAQGGEMHGLAADKLAAALALRPGDRALAERVLDLQVNLLRLDEARALAARLFAAPADLAAARYWEGRCLDTQLDAAGARAAFGEALAADPRHAGAALELARLDLDDGDAAAARERLLDLPRGVAQATRRALLLGQAETALGHDAEAEAALREALRLEPGSVKAAYLLGRLLVRTGRKEEGQALLKRVAGP
jgi:tetratricopeptide (TPR) repeat protein